MYLIHFIRIENIAGDEMGRIICSHLLARAYIFFLYKIIMHTWRSDVYDSIVANYMYIQYL